MRRPNSLLVGALLAGALLAAILQISRNFQLHQLGGTAVVEPPSLTTWAAALAALAVAAAVGRIALSLLPPGLPGGHAPRAAAHTWAASHLLGLTALGAERTWLALAGIDPAPALLLAPWGAVLALRLATLPGRLRPRHDLAAPAPDLALRLALVAIAVSASLPLARVALGHLSGGATPAGAPGPGPGSAAATGAWLLTRVAGLAPERTAAPLAAIAAASWVALCALVSHGLEQARRAPFVRAAVLLILVLTPYGIASATRSSGPTHAALLVGGASALMIPWLRRGDFRALALAAIAFAAAAHEGGAAQAAGLAGAAALLVATPAPSRRRALVALIAAFLLLAATAARIELGRAGIVDLARTLAALSRAAASPVAWGAGWFCAVPAVFLAVLHWTIGRRLARRPRPGEEDVGRDLAALAGAAAVGLVAVAFALARPGATPGAEALDAGLLLIWPAAALITGLIFAPPSRP